MIEENLVNLEKLVDHINNQTSVWCYQPAPNQGRTNEWYAELEYVSSLGQSTLECVFFDGTVQSFVDSLIALNQRYEEHCRDGIKFYMRGADLDLRELVDDADKKVKFFDDFTSMVVNYVRKEAPVS